MKALLWDAINPATGTPFTFDDPNLFWGAPSYYLEPDDPPTHADVQTLADKLGQLINALRR